MSQFDVFISHASEDKADVAHPLAEILKRSGVRVWLDKFELRVGDSLREAIDLGLRNSRYGVVVLSSHFFEKKWPARELNGLFALEDERKRILPVWHGVSKSDVAKYSPILADRLAANTSEGINAVAAAIASVVQKDGITASLAGLIEAGPNPVSLASFLKVHPHILAGCIGQFGLDDHPDYSATPLAPFHLTSHILRGTDGSADWRCCLFLPSRPNHDVHLIIATLDQCERAITEANLSRKETANRLSEIKQRGERDFRRPRSTHPHFSGAIFLGRRGELSETLEHAIRKKKENSYPLQVMRYDRLLEASVLHE